VTTIRLPERRLVAPPVLDGVELAPPLDDSFMDPRGYFSEAFYDLELREVFARSWIFVCDVQDVGEPGDYVTETIGYEPVVVVRGHDRELRAFSNVCRHRASTVVQGMGNCGKTMTCPYHGWTYHLDGRLTGVPYQRDLVCPIERDHLGLHELRMAVWERWVFVNVSGDAPPLSDYLEEIPALLGRHEFAMAHRGYQLDDEVAANWKILMDNAYCDYHLPFVHAESLGKFVDPHGLDERTWTYTGRVLARSSPYGGGPYRILPELEGEAREGSIGCAAFPNFYIAAFPNGGCTVMWWTPLAIDKTRARVLSYTRDPEEDFRAGKALLQQIQNEDYAICRKVQQGLRSALYRTGPRHDLELKIRGYQRMLMQMLANAVSSGRAGRHTGNGMFEEP
jgi:choline monooxygenase